MQHWGGIPNDPSAKQARAQDDLALLFSSDLHVGSERLPAQKRKGTALNMRYYIDDAMHQRGYSSALSWRAVLLFALTEGRSVTVQEMDLPGRYRRLFPHTLLRLSLIHI